MLKLPTIPRNLATLPEEVMERRIARLIDHADEIYMIGQCSKEEYDAWFHRLEAAIK